MAVIAEERCKFAGETYYPDEVIPDEIVSAPERNNWKDLEDRGLVRIVPDEYMRTDLHDMSEERKRRAIYLADRNVNELKEEIEHEHDVDLLKEVYKLEKNSTERSTALEALEDRLDRLAQMAQEAKTYEPEPEESSDEDEHEEDESKDDESED